MFDKNLKKFNNNICFITKDKTYTYNEIDNLVTQIEKNLTDEKKLIFIKTKNNIETVLMYLAVLRKNYAFLMLNSALENEMIENLIEKYQPNYIWEEKEVNKNYIYEFNNYGLKLNNEENLNLNEELSMILSTSGSTGSSKLVRLKKDNIYANCHSIVEYLKIDSTQRTITTLPLHYSYGISVLNTHLFKGASIVLGDYSIISKEFWNDVKNYDVTTLNGVPYSYEIFKKIGLMKMDLPSLKYLTQAGGKLNSNLVEEFALWAKEKNINFFVMYGQTEATARISYLPPEKTLLKVSSIGIPIPKGKLYIKDLSSAKIIEEPNKEGELIYEGPNVMMGYATSLTDLSKGDELKGVLHTGDVAYMDEEGYFYINGRLKRFIKIYGNRVNLDEIEHFLKSQNIDALCTGVDDKLLIATKDDELEEIKKVVVKKYKFHRSIIKIKKVDEYPVSTSGKIQYQKLLEMLK
jgi:acyl-coenzyme A synthetase/AMP-(fatty) acid ligase